MRRSRQEESTPAGCRVRDRRCWTVINRQCVTGCSARPGSCDTCHEIIVSPTTRDAASSSIADYLPAFRLKMSDHAERALQLHVSAYLPGQPAGTPPGTCPGLLANRRCPAGCSTCSVETSVVLIWTLSCHCKCRRVRPRP